MTFVKGYLNCFSLGLSFLGGTFVSQEFLSDKLKTIGSFNPIFWYVKVTDATLYINYALYSLYTICKIYTIQRFLIKSIINSIAIIDNTFIIIRFQLIENLRILGTKITTNVKAKSHKCNLLFAFLTL